MAGKVDSPNRAFGRIYAGVAMRLGGLSVVSVRWAGDQANSSLAPFNHLVHQASSVQPDQAAQAHTPTIATTAEAVPPCSHGITHDEDHCSAGQWTCRGGN